MSAVKALTKWAASSTIAHVAFGFVAMGAWAVFANRAHPLAEALQAGLVQGLISGSLTLVLKKALEWMNVRLSAAAGRNLIALILPPVVTAATIFAILVSIHTLAGTPEIAATIAVPFSVSTLYACLYTLRLWRAANAGSR